MSVPTREKKSDFYLGSPSSSTQFTQDFLLKQEVTDNDEKDECHPDELLQCPYDNGHKIRACRFPYHIIKCKKNHPKLASELNACPFNAQHLVPPHKMPHHIATCANRQLATADSSKVQNKWQAPVNLWTAPTADEDWDRETEDTPEPPFIWGVSNSELNGFLPAEDIRPQPAGRNYLAPGLRAPNTLPWR